MKTFALMYAAALCAVASSADATPVIYTDQAAFLAAIQSSVTDTFEENATGGFTPYFPRYTGSGFDIVSSSTVLYTIDPAVNPTTYQFNSGDVVTPGTGLLTISVDPNFVALGFDFGNPASADNRSSTGFITINGLNYSEPTQPTLSFFGIVDSAGGIGPVVVNYNGGLGILDNLVTARVVRAGPTVPEPATWAMMLVGFGLIGGAARYRQCSTATTYV